MIWGGREKYFERNVGSMYFSNYELLWFFLIYSFLGWILETVVAAFKQKRFVNKGLVTLPFCILYGMAAVTITVFCRELTGVWLYIGSVILITVFRWVAGGLIEKIYHEKWWDYSERRWNIGGYVSLIDSAVLGIIAVVMMKWGNVFFAAVFRFIPQKFRNLLLWIMAGLLLADIATTFLAFCGKECNASGLIKLEHRFTRFTDGLSRKIYSYIDKRLKKAYPETKKVETVKKSEVIFAYGCSFYKIVWLFLIGSFLGDVTETIFCRLTTGIWMSRSSVVWGPFSIVWGLAIAMVTILLYKYRNKPDRNIFIAGTLLGGAYEYICSVFTEMVFGKVFWDYSHLRFNLGGRINLLYCFFWGIAAVVWIKGIYPVISKWIEKIPVKIGKILTWFVIIFMCCNIVVSSLALIRSTQRSQGVSAEQKWQKVLDERFDDERLERIYPNAIAKRG